MSKSNDEGWAKQILADDWNVYSAGIETHGVNPKAIEAMKEVGIDISNPYIKFNR